MSVKCVKCTKDVEEFISELDYMSRADREFNSVIVTSNLGYFASVLLRHGKPVLPEVARDVSIFSPDKRRLYIYIPANMVYMEETRDIIAFLLADAIYGAFFDLNLKLLVPHSIAKRQDIEAINYMLAEPKLVTILQPVHTRYTVTRGREDPLFRSHVERAGKMKAKALSERLQFFLTTALENGIIGEEFYELAMNIHTTALAYKLYMDECLHHETCTIIDDEKKSLEHRMLILMEHLLREILAPLYNLRVVKTKKKREDERVYTLTAYVAPRDWKSFGTVYM